MQPEIRLPGKQTTRAISMVGMLRNTELGKRSIEDGSREKCAQKECRTEEANGGTRDGERQRQGMTQEEDEQEEDDPRGQYVEIAKGQRRIRDTEEAAVEEENSAEMRTKTKKPIATPQARAQSMDAEEGQEAEEEEAEAATCENDRRTLRKRKKDSYDQTRRRTRTRVTATAYLERREGHGLCKRRAILMGTATIERIVDGRYEWRDGGMRKIKDVRKRYWAVMHGTDHQVDTPSTRRRH